MENKKRYNLDEKLVRGFLFSPLGSLAEKKKVHSLPGGRIFLGGR